MLFQLLRRIFPLRLTTLVYLWMLVLIFVPLIFVAILVSAQHWPYENLYPELLGSAQLILGVGLLTMALSAYFSWRVFQRLGAGLKTFADAVVQNNSESIRGLLPELDLVLDVVKTRAQELIKANACFNKAFCASPSMMCLVDFESGAFLDVNASFTAATGFERSELVGKRYDQVQLWQSPEGLTRFENKVLQEIRLSNHELSILTKQGSVRTALVSTECIELDGQDCLLIVGVDITERKMFQTEMQRFDRLNLVGEMAAGISHEIRNPLTTVRGFLQMLSVKGECAQYQDYYALMIEELDRTNSIITEFLSLGRNKDVTFERHNLTKIIQALAPLIEANAAAEEKALVLDLKEVPDLLLNEKEIRQVVLNLARNGLEAMDSGGTLTLRTWGHEGEVVLEVKDQGQGIDSEVLTKLGTPFVTTKEQGTGLGLAVCYSIAERHHARIVIDSSSRGTSFKVRFGYSGTKSQT